MVAERIVKTRSKINDMVVCKHQKYGQKHPVAFGVMAGEKAEWIILEVMYISMQLNKAYKMWVPNIIQIPFKKLPKFHRNQTLAKTNILPWFDQKITSHRVQLTVHHPCTHGPISRLPPGNCPPQFRSDSDPGNLMGWHCPFFSIYFSNSLLFFSNFFPVGFIPLVLESLETSWGDIVGRPGPKRT